MWFVDVGPDPLLTKALSGAQSERVLRIWDAVRQGGAETQSRRVLVLTGLVLYFRGIRFISCYFLPYVKFLGLTKKRKAWTCWPV